MKFEAWEADESGRLRKARWPRILAWIFRFLFMAFVTLVAAGIMALAGSVRWAAAVGIGVVAYLVCAAAFRWLTWARRRREFRLLGRVLDGGTIMIHSIRPATPQAVPVESESLFQAQRNVQLWIDVTVTPVKTPSSYELWEPQRIRCVPSDRAVGSKIEDEPLPGRYGPLDVQVRRGDWFGLDLDTSYTGKERVRLLVQLPIEASSARFV